MIGKDKLAELLRPLVNSQRADGIEAVVIAHDSGLTRFANNTIHQNVATDNAQVSLRTILGGRIGLASTNRLDAQSLDQCLERSLQIAELMPATPDWPGLPAPTPLEPLETFDQQTAELDPAGRAQIVKRIIAVAQDAGQSTAGAFKTGATEVAVFSSAGMERYQPLTGAALTVVNQHEDGSGYASEAARAVEQVDYMRAAQTAMRKAETSRGPGALDPGTYDVLLEPEAVAGAIEWLNFIGFGSRSFEQQTGFLAGRRDNKIAGDQITIVDDGRHPGALPMPFDFEGVPRRRVPLIQGGLAKGPVHCTLSGARAGTVSTGHALPPEESSEGALPLNLVVEPGPENPQQMLEGLERGILITRFHYINGFLDTRKAVLTGLTRDGTFWVENGKIIRPLKQLRFTQNFIEAFSNVAALGNERRTVTSWWGELGAIYAPAMLIRGFKITGITG
ncbi:MAG: TldD/PmbA family protein [Candidatus Alcyoniella australis]|nr:TldD/PmbA family protein [Candidatus Alcyoniella australis]